MTRLIVPALWVLLIAVAPPAVYAAGWTVGTDFIDNVMSGLLATAAALIGGIPIVLWIDRAIKQREEAKSLQENRRREIELLDLLREELSFSESLHAQRNGKPPVQPLKADLWAAASAAGQLNLIVNHRLLNRIASAYYVINVVRKIEEQAYFSSRSAFASFSVEAGKSAGQLLLEDARGFDGLLSTSITEALREIEQEVGTRR